MEIGHGIGHVGGDKRRGKNIQGMSVGLRGSEDDMGARTGCLRWDGVVWQAFEVDRVSMVGGGNGKGAWALW